MRTWSNHNVKVFAAVALVIAGVFGSTAHAAEKTTTPAGERPYSDGPLTPGDFLGPIPNDPPPRIQAVTEVAFRWKTEYRYARLNGSIVAKLTRVTFTAMVVRDKSWNSRKDDRYLLGHEQGHFDISQMHAIEMEMALTERIRAGKPPMGKGADEAAAARDLEVKVREFAETQAAVHRERQVKYDEVTGGASLVQKQLDVQQENATALKAQQTKLDESRKKSN